jgi:hypothetical protein
MKIISAGFLWLIFSSSIYASLPKEATSKPEDLLMLAKITLLPYLEADRLPDITRDILDGTPPSHLHRLISSENYARTSLWALNQAGWLFSDVRRRMSESKERFEGTTVRPMRKSELSLLEKPFETDMTWLSIQGALLQKSPHEEISALTAGINLGKSYGLTSAGQESARKLALPVYDTWHHERPSASPVLTTVALLTASLTAIIIGLLSAKAGKTNHPRRKLLLREALACCFAVVLAYFLWRFFPIYILWQFSVTLSVLLAFLLFCIPFFALPSSCGLDHLRSSESSPSSALFFKQCDIFGHLLIFLGVFISSLNIFPVLPVLWGGGFLVLAIFCVVLWRLAPLLPRIIEKNHSPGCLAAVLISLWAVAVIFLSLALPSAVVLHLSSEESVLNLAKATLPHAPVLVAVGLVFLVVLKLLPVVKLRSGNFR